MTTRLVFPPYFPKDKGKRQYFIEKHRNLPPMKENQLQLFGVGLTFNENQQIVVTAFIRSTIVKPVSLKMTHIFLLNQNLEPIAQKEEDFKELGILQPNTSVPWKFIFPEDNLFQVDLSEVETWSLVFEEEVRHQLDLSDMDEGEISEQAKNQLKEIIQQSSLDKNELSLVGLSAKRNKTEGIEVTLLIQNGTINNLEIKQLPLKFYDAAGELTAQGTFQLSDFHIRANTSKPMSLVFPKTSILKEKIDLTSWSIQHVQ